MNEKQKFVPYMLKRILTRLMTLIIVVAISVAFYTYFVNNTCFIPIAHPCEKKYQIPPLLIP